MKQLWQKLWGKFDGKKTLTFAVLNALLPLIPGVGPKIQAWIAAHPAEYAQFVGGMVALLRSVTTKPIKKVENTSDK